jgi:hypothetical protein
MAAVQKALEMIMTYQPSREVFPSDAVSLQEKMLRLRQQIIEAQQYRRKLEGEETVQATDDVVLSACYWRVEKQITDLRIWEMESRMTALLDIQGD